MVKKFVKGLCLSLALTLVVGASLVGCGANSGAKTETTAAEQTTAAQASETTAAAETEKKLEPYTLKMYMLAPNGTQKDQDVIKEEASKYLESKINAKLDIVFCDWNIKDKVNLATQSGEQFDLTFTASWNDYAAMVAKGAFVALDELLDKYAPKTKAQMNKAYLLGPKVAGKLYAIPTEKECASTYGYVFKKEFVDKYGFDVAAIKTYKDIEPMLQTIKEKEPGVVPLSGGGLHFKNVLFERISGYAGVIYRDGRDTKVVNPLETPEYMEIMKTTHEWFKKGYINKDVVTRKDGNAEFHKSGKWFAEITSLKPGYAEEQETSRGYKLVQVDLNTPYSSTDDATNSMMAISANSKDPARAMMAIEYMHTEKDLANLLVWGIKDKHYVMKSENMISLPAGVDSKSNPYSPGSNWTLGNQFLTYLMDNENPKKWEMFKEFNDKATPSKIIGFNFNAEPVKNEVAACNTIAFEDNSKFEALDTGSALDPAVYVPKAIDELKKAGIDKLIAEKQKQIDEFLAANK